MNLRPSQASTFALVRSGLFSNARKLVGLQQQISSGRRILKPSDDVVGSTRALSVRRQLSSVDRYLSAINTSRPTVDMAAAALQDGSGLFAEARELVIQGMNGTLNQDDRNTIANQIDLVAERLFDIANSKSGEHYLFGGTETDQRAFVKGASSITYAGNEEVRRVAIGSETDIQVNVSGSDTFAKFEYSGATLAGLTGIALGTTANQGVGSEQLHVRHDATNGTLGGGIAFANGGADDTIMGPHSLTIDGATNTIQLGSGTAIAIPDPLPADLVLKDADGSEVHLDMTGFTGVDVSTTLTGTGSVSLDGVNYVAINGTDTDLELSDPATGSVIHVDVTEVTRAGNELVHFAGTVDTFAALKGIADDLRNGDDLEPTKLVHRIELGLVELDRNHNNLLTSLSKLGGASQRISATEDQALELNVQLQGILSDIEDADYADVILKLTQTEQTLELTQLSGTRLLQTSLLNFLR